MWLVVVALGYFLAGRAGQLCASPPSYATAVWPPSGIALAAVLMIGSRVWPGILVGALAVNGWSHWLQADGQWSWVQDVLVPCSISLGVTAQALLGGRLIRHTIGFPNPLIQDRQILAFLGLGGPVACLVGPTWGVASLAAAGKVHGVWALMLNWWTWWVGDVIGVIIFAPLMLICFARPRKLWRPRWISVALPLCGTMAVIVLGIGLTQVLDTYHTSSQFNRIAGGADQLLKSQVERHFSVIDSLHRYFEFSQFINRDEFTHFVEESSRDCAALVMIAWAPLEREALEEELRRGDPPIDGLSSEPGQDEHEADSPAPNASPSVANRTGHGSPRPALAGNPPTLASGSSVTVAYLYPAPAPFLAVGEDFGSKKNWRQLMRRCCDTGQRLASPPFLADGAEQNRDPYVLILDPVYRRDSKPGNIRERRENFRGFLISVFSIKPLLQNASPLRDIGNYQLTIRDVTDPQVQRVVYAPRQPLSPHKSSEVPAVWNRNFEVVSRIWFSGRDWDCRYTPTAYFYATHLNRETWLMLACGLALTAVLGAFLLILSGRTAQIEASEERYLDLYENAPDMFISLDVKSQRVIECNRTFLDATGFPKQAVLDKHVDELFDANSRAEARRAFRAFLTQGHVSDIELQLLCRDGNLIDISMKMSAVRGENGESISCRAALRDITARKRVEADLKAQEMELAHAGRLSMMGEMAAGLAHEINQPLAAIAAYAEGASIRIRDGNPNVESLNKVLQRIATDAHRAGQIIRRLRQFLRKRAPERVHLRLNDLVREVALFVDSDLRRRDVRMWIELAPDLPVVLGDPIQIQQVLVNLIRNSCDAMLETAPTRRSLLIRTRCAEGESAHVTVEDSGHGLSSDASDQLFEAFFSTKDDGLGMGLAISRSIIEAHGGQIWATSNPEGGASFHFSLPAHSEVCA